VTVCVACASASLSPVLSGLVCDSVCVCVACTSANLSPVLSILVCDSVCVSCVYQCESVAGGKYISL